MFSILSLALKSNFHSIISSYLKMFPINRVTHLCNINTFLVFFPHFYSIYTVLVNRNSMSILMWIIHLLWKRAKIVSKIVVLQRSVYSLSNLKLTFAVLLLYELIVPEVSKNNLTSINQNKLLPTPFTAIQNEEKNNNNIGHYKNSLVNRFSLIGHTLLTFV